MEALKNGLYLNPDVNLILDLEFAFIFEQLINKMLDMIEASDTLG